MLYMVEGHRRRDPGEIGVHALRCDIVGEHTVYFCGDGERELTHRATDRKIFGQGAMSAHWAG